MAPSGCRSAMELATSHQNSNPRIRLFACKERGEKIHHLIPFCHAPRHGIGQSLDSRTPCVLISTPVVNEGLYGFKGTVAGLEEESGEGYGNHVPPYEIVLLFPDREGPDNRHMGGRLPEVGQERYRVSIGVMLLIGVFSWIGRQLFQDADQMGVISSRRVTASSTSTRLYLLSKTIERLDELPDALLVHPFPFPRLQRGGRRPDGV